ncbi:CBS domain-containing protein [Actinoallomurus spadix]|uniref:CBS domain-containing protein n=1 Tax=Actinoallomurus spadix TaxID=79912 RepID=A0ABP3HHK9_9ACTN|nr:CBS domain-containing protein [Actinoallomurus spadix]MCO5991322.1 CBS domain-containing protein [Actinoallomurus spadix]
MAQKVRDVMTPEPVALPLDAPLTEAARLMRDQGIGGVLVTQAGRLCGLLTDRDIVVRAVAEGRDLYGTRLDQVCSAGVVTIGPDDEAEAAVRLMRERGVRRLPVVEEGRAVGIVSLRDVMAADITGDVAGDTTNDLTGDDPGARAAPGSARPAG